MHSIKSIFTVDEIRQLKDKILVSSEQEIDKSLGRYIIDQIEIPYKIQNKINTIAKQEALSPCTVGGFAMYVRYSLEYGKPTLPPHYDGCTTPLIMNYQLESNTSWGLGLNTQSYDMVDNSALIFNPNENIHWRPHKRFESGEYVDMIFFRLYDVNKEYDYSHMTLDANDPAFDEVKAYRNSLS